MDHLLNDIENDPDFGQAARSRNAKLHDSKTQEANEDVFTEAVSLGIGIGAVNKVTELKNKIQLLRNDQEDEDYLENVLDIEEAAGMVKDAAKDII